MKFKRILKVSAAFAALWLAPVTNHGVTIIQSSGAQFVAWEAEDTDSISNLTSAPTPAPAVSTMLAAATAAAINPRPCIRLPPVPSRQPHPVGPFSPYGQRAPRRLTHSSQTEASGIGAA